MFWYSVLKELTHFIAEGCLQRISLPKLILCWELNQKVCQSAWAQSSQPQSLKLPQEKVKRHTVLTSAFDSAIYNSAVDPIMEGTESKCPSGCTAGSPDWQAGQIPRCWAMFSVARGYSSPSLAKPPERAGDFTRKMPDSSQGQFCCSNRSQRLASNFK